MKELAKRKPSANGDNGGRDALGRFGPGNAGGPGNPHARKVAQLRTALLRSVKASDLRAGARAVNRV